MRVGNGKSIDFLHDIWCGKLFLKDKLPGLYNICTNQNCSVNDLCNENWDWNFRRWLDEGLQDQLRRLRGILFKYKVNEEKDVAIWDSEKTGKFTVKSMYTHVP